MTWRDLLRFFNRSEPATLPDTPAVPQLTRYLEPSTIARCTGSTLANAEKFAPHINAAMDEFGIDTPVRQAAFLAQIGHESGGLRFATEIWGPTQAQLRYEGRVDLGNTYPDDGFRYRGRGLIQVTGRANYRRMGRALGLDLEYQPERLAEPELAARSAACFWNAHDLNLYADNGAFDTLTRKINGGLTGYAERVTLWTAAKAALGVDSRS